MTELRFHQELYDGFAIDEAVKAFAGLARFEKPPAAAHQKRKIQAVQRRFEQFGRGQCPHQNRAVTRFAAAGNPVGNAGGDQFRTAPLWGLGQRIFLLHDGRTTNLITAIQDHASHGSEATTVEENFFDLNSTQQQEVLDFLRSL